MQMSFIPPMTFLGVIAIVFVITSIRAARANRSDRDYFLASRNLGTWELALTLVATQVGSGMLLGTFEESYLNGIYGIVYTLSLALGFILLSLGVAARLRALEVPTTAHIFEKYYGSPTLKKVASLVSILTLFGLLIGQVVASHSIIAAWTTAATPVFLFLWFLIVVHTVFGGLSSLAFTDSLQLLFIVGTFIAIFVTTLSTVPFQLSYLAPPQKVSGLLIGTLFMPALFALIEQDLAQRFFAARTQQIASRATLLAGVIIGLFACIPTYLGSITRFVDTQITTGSFASLFILIQHIAGSLMANLAACAMMAAIITTADSLLCAIASNLCQDFDLSWTGVKNPVHRSRTVTLMVGCAALITSFWVSGRLIPILVKSYTLSVSTLLAPLLLVYCNRPCSKKVAILSMLTGAVSFAIVSLLPLPEWTILAPVCLSGLVAVIGNQLFSSTD